MTDPRDLEVLLKLNPGEQLSDEEETQVRRHFGYASSESRTRLERRVAARRILARVGGGTFREAVKPGDLHPKDVTPELLGDLQEKARGRR